MNTTTKPNSDIKTARNSVLNKRSGINLTLYVAGVGSAGMAASLHDARGAVLYHEFDPNFYASHEGNGRSRIGVSVDVVNGLRATDPNEGSDLVFYSDRLTFAPGQNGGTHGNHKGVGSDPSPTTYTPASIMGSIRADTVTLGSIIDESTTFGGAPFSKDGYPATPGTNYVGFYHSPDDGENSHYGWIRYDYEPGLDGHIRLLEGAVESTPGVGIRVGGQAPVPEPGVVALLALGAAGFVRRRRTQVA